MIPYEELCDALARWRAKNGLAVRRSTGPVRAISLPPSDRPMLTPARGAPLMVQQPAPPEPLEPVMNDLPFLAEELSAPAVAADSTQEHEITPEPPLRSEESATEIDISDIVDEQDRR